MQKNIGILNNENYREIEIGISLKKTEFIFLKIERLNDSAISVFCNR